MKLIIVIPTTMLLAMVSTPLFAASNLSCYTTLDGGKTDGTLGTVYKLTGNLTCSPPSGNTVAAFQLQNGAVLDLNGYTLKCNSIMPAIGSGDGVRLISGVNNAVEVTSSARSAGTIEYCNIGINQQLPSPEAGTATSTINNVNTNYNAVAGMGLYTNVNVTNSNSEYNAGSGLIARDTTWLENNVNITGGNYSYNGSQSGVNSTYPTCTMNIAPNGPGGLDGAGINDFRYGIDIRGGYNDTINGVTANGNYCTGIGFEGYISSSTVENSTANNNGVANNGEWNLNGIQVSDSVNGGTTAGMPNNLNQFLNNKASGNYGEKSTVGEGADLYEYLNSNTCSDNTWSGNTTGTHGNGAYIGTHC